MKKSLIALAALASFAGAASAQVTLSGMVDFAVQNVNDQWRAGSAGSGRNNLTFGIVEDLGGGMAAYGTLNHRFKLTDGTLNPGSNASQNSGNTQFYRNAFMGLRGGFGQIQVGRHLSPLQLLNGNYDAFGTDFLGSVHTGGLNAAVRTNGLVSYTTPNLGGFTATAAIAPGENQSNGTFSATTGAFGATTSKERPAGFNARYQAGAIDVGAAWDRNANDLTTKGVYGGFTFGGTRLNVQYEQGDLTATTDAKRYGVSAKVPMGNANLMVGYVRRPDEKTNKFGLGVEYGLSKRTSVYTDMGKTGGNGATTLAKKAQYEVGVSHRF